MAISSDIPVNVSFEEFLIAELTIAILSLFMIYLTIKGNPWINILVLIIPNSIWIFNLTNDLKYNTHPYDTIISITMISVLSTIFLWNTLKVILILRSNPLKFKI
tara:strand:+ start:631 stop:945 length:315 start_codon:yes stop_codon:yes gene_type:complete